MFFIILSIASFVLRTLPMFETHEYDVLTFYPTNESIQRLIIHNSQLDINSNFDTIEWICMKTSD